MSEQDTQHDERGYGEDGYGEDDDLGAVPARPAVRNLRQDPRWPYEPGERRRPPVPVNRDLWEHVIESAVIMVTGTLLTAWLLPRTVTLPLIVGLGAVITFTTWWSSLKITGALFVSNMLFAWGALITLWLTFARLLGAWHADVLAGLFLPAALLTPVTAVAIGHHRSAARRAIMVRQDTAQGAPERRWELTLARHGAPGCKVLEVIEFEAETQVHGRLAKATDSRQPLTFDVLKMAARGIAVSRRLTGDSVYFEQGETEADFILHLRKKGTRKKEIHLPLDNAPQSINNPLRLGEYDSGRAAELLLREVTTMIVGVRGSGKSNLLNVFIALLARCTDCLVFMIDLKGGRTARPWFQPWVQELDGVERPVIDWLATTREEAELMLRALIAGGQARASSGEGWEKIIPSRKVPAVILICDETAIMTGHGTRKDGISNATLAQLLAEYVETFRSEAMDYVGSALRANVDIMGSTAVKAMSEVRIGLRVTDAGEGQSIFPDHHAAAVLLSKLRDKGSGLIKVGPDISPATLFYRIGSEERILDIAQATGGLRPVPEARLREAMGSAYEERWNRPHGQALLDMWRAAANLPAPREARDQDEFDQIISASYVADPEKPANPHRARMHDLLRERGFQGYTASRLLAMLAAEGKAPAREVLHRWLAEDETKGLVRRTGAPLHRWIWGQYVAEAVIPDDNEE